MNESGTLTVSVAVLLAGAIVTALLGQRGRLCGYVAAGFVGASALGLIRVGAGVLTGAPPVQAEPWLVVPGLGARLALHVDDLSRVFLLVISLIGFCATLYSARYIERYPQYSAARYYPLLLLFFASVVGVVGTADWLFFLVFWELMTLTSYTLVVYEAENQQASRAGLRYFITTHLATGCLLLAIIILYVWGGRSSFQFDVARASMEEMLAKSPATAHVVLALFLLGFATKAGILPFGFWLPDAYPAAPTGASAAFSGTMTKLGVYGILRAFVCILPPSFASSVWGVIIALLGTVSIGIGTLTALQQSDSKRLLSFHMIGQTGYMLLGIGTGIAFRHIWAPLAVLGLVGGLFHVVNNACYKSLLFLNAGACLYRTGTRDLNQVGGLAAIMPTTAATALVASLSIAGVPPFSGFSSKWLIYQAAIGAGFQMPIFILLGIIAAFISLVTLASFLKFLGSLFLGSLRFPKPDIEEQDVPLSMVVPQVAIAVFCVLFGVSPMLALHPLWRAVWGITALDSAQGLAPPFAALFGSSAIGALVRTGPGLAGFWGPQLVVPALVVCTLLTVGIARLGGARVRRVPVWACGEKHAAHELAYTAHSFMLTWNRLFSHIYPQVPLPRAPSFKTVLTALDVDRWVLLPAVRLGEKIAQGLSRAHVGFPQAYLAWQIVAVVVVIAILFAIRGGG